MASDFIDLFLQKLVEREIFQGIPSWELLKDYLVQHCMMDQYLLETRREEIVEKFIRCKHEQLERAIPDLMGTTVNKVISATPDEALTDDQVRESAGLEQKTTRGKRIDLEEKGEEGGEASEPIFHPHVDETLSTDNAHSEGLNSESACCMSVYLPNGKWGGAALKYCKEEESYISLRIIERYKLRKEMSADGRIRLTWRLNGEEETNVTQFSVHENLKCDFMLGIRHLDEDFNREDSSEDDEDVNSVSSPSKYSEPMESPLPQMYSLPEIQSSDLRKFAKYVGIANMESIGAKMREMEISKSGSNTPRHERRVANDTQSAPSLAPSSRRPRQVKKGPPTAISAESSLAQRHNTTRRYS